MTVSAHLQWEDDGGRPLATPEHIAPESRQVRRARERAEQKIADKTLKMQPRERVTTYCNNGEVAAVNTPREILTHYETLGLPFVLWPEQGDNKGPNEAGWPNKRDRAADYSAGMRAGLLTGTESTFEPGHFVVDAEIDWADGALIAQAFLPPTGFVYGRASKRVSHCLYLCDAALVSVRYEDIDKTCLIELRGTKKDGSIGMQSMAPPSVWSKDGQREPLQFVAPAQTVNGYRPTLARVAHARLQRAVVLGAVGMLLAKHLGHNGFGHDTRLAWAGFLLRAGVTEEELITMGEAISGYCNNLEVSDVRTVVKSTEQALRTQHKVVGSPKLAELIGDHGPAVIARIREWLGKNIQQQRVELLRASEVKMVKLDWLWHARLVRGGITLLEGRPEVGKSTLLIDLAARVSRGHSFPGETTTREPGSIVMLIAEDDLAATVVPRLVAAGADLNRIFFLHATKNEEGEVVPFQLTDDCDRLRVKCEEVGAVLVIVDPLVSYLGSRRGRTINTYNDLEVRQALAPLKELADRTRAAVVAIRHYRKGRGTDALEAGGGSVAFAALVRVIIAALPDPEEEEEEVEEEGRYLLAVAKNNLVKRSERPAFAYQIVPWTGDPDVGCIAWGATVDKSANEIFAAQSEAAKTSSGKVGEAKEFLTTLLAKGEWMLSTELISAAKANGFSEASVHRARAAMPIVVEKQGTKWGWRLAPREDPPF